MKQNPCRYCIMSLEYKGKHIPNHKEECARCDNRAKHDKYLKEQRKFEIGNTITSMDELLNQEYVYVRRSNAPKHIEVIKSWQLRLIQQTLCKGHFYKAIRKTESEANTIETD